MEREKGEREGKRDSDVFTNPECSEHLTCDSNAVHSHVPRRTTVHVLHPPPSLQCAKLANSNPSVAYQTATDRNDCYRLGDVTDPSWEVMDPAKPRKGIVLKYVHSYSYSHTSSYSYSYSYSSLHSSLFLSLFEPS